MAGRREGGEMSLEEEEQAAGVDIAMGEARVWIWWRRRRRFGDG